MKTIRPPIPAKLFVGMLSPDVDLFQTCVNALSSRWGTIDLTSGIMPWTTSDYYRKEMGADLFRQFIFFHELIDQGELPSIKNYTYELEKQLALQKKNIPCRRINLDPGYVTEAKVVLATTKDYSHRLYIGEGIYAEVTLRFDTKDRSFSALEHTYYDYRSDLNRMMFNQARDLLRTELQSHHKP